ncbi:MAG: polysaccharide biosynthesis C-terminal domain-containing protein [Saprospirales bacterium]|nr:polysaccharide biosynthesis C-terminal domain-containing protein [Saprospirales bacterium]
MGIIQRQGIKHSIVNFSGLAIGMLSTLFIYSQKEVVEAYGLMQYLLSIAIIGFPLFALSGNTVAVRFFPVFQDKTQAQHGFLPFLLLLCLLGWGTSALVAFFCWDWIKVLVAWDTSVLQEYLWMAFPLTFLFTVALLLYQYSLNFKRIVIPSILFDFSLKVALPALLIGIWQHWIDLKTALNLLLLYYVAVILGQVQYLRYLKEWHWRINWAYFTPALRRDIGKYAGFGILSGFALLLATKADNLMVGSLIGMKSTGVYAIALNIAAAMEIPTKSLYSASVSFVSRYLSDENWAELRSLYQKVSINLLTAGLFIFGCIWLSAGDLYLVMPNSQEAGQGRYVLFFLSMAKLVDMGAGLNNQLVYYSKFYRYSIFSLGVLAVANVVLNIWLVPVFGITGTAVATLLSICCYNFFNLYLVWKKFNMQPFSSKTLLVCLLAAGSIAVLWHLPSTGFHLFNIVLRCSLFALLFGFLVLRFGVSDDISKIWRERSVR